MRIFERRLLGLPEAHCYALVQLWCAFLLTKGSFGSTPIRQDLRGIRRLAKNNIISFNLWAFFSGLLLCIGANKSRSSAVAAHQT